MAVTQPTKYTAIGTDLGYGVPLISVPLSQTIHSNPGANTIGTVTVAANPNGRHVCVGITAGLASGGTAISGVTLALRDGASGVGPIIWQVVLSCLANGASPLIADGLNIVGSPNTAMTLEFLTAPGAGNFESVALLYLDVSQ